MAALNLNFNKLTVIIFLFVILKNKIVNGYGYGCAQHWNLNLNETMKTNDWYMVFVDPDQVYSVKSPGLYLLKYPKSSLFTWYLQPSDDKLMSIVIYILYMDTDSNCDILKVSTFNETMHKGHLPAHSKTNDSVYWSGNINYAYDRSTKCERFLAMDFVKSTAAVLQFKTDNTYNYEYSSSPGFVIRVLPLLNSRRIVVADKLNVVELIATGSQVQQVELNPGHLKYEFEETQLTIYADDSSKRVYVKVIYMNIHEYNCHSNYIKMFDGDRDTVDLMMACRNSALTTPIQTVSVTNSLIIRYKCNPIQIYDLRNSVYETSPCAIINYKMYDPEIYEDRHFHPEKYTELKLTDFEDPLEFGGQLRFSLKSNTFIEILMQSNKEEFDQGIVQFSIRSNSGLTSMQIKHILIGESPKYAYELMDGEMLDGSEFKEFWLTVEKDKVSAGTGNELGQNTEISQPLSGNLQLKYFRMNMDAFTVVRLYGDCDESLTQNAKSLPMGSGDLYESVSTGSIYSRTWVIRKKTPNQILQLRVTASLLQSPECEWEGVTFYRGSCPTWEKKIAVFCGDVEETYSQTTHSVTVIKFHSEAGYSTVKTFHGRSKRFFEIHYKEMHAEEKAEKKPTNVGLLIAIAISVIIVVLVICVICYIKVVNVDKPRRVAAQDILRHKQMKTMRTQEIKSNNNPPSPSRNKNQPIQLKIEIDNTGRIMGVPNSLYQGKIQTSVVYTGIPPAAIYDPPRTVYSGTIPTIKPVYPEKH